jgi:hypothetical protein
MSARPDRYLLPILVLAAACSSPPSTEDEIGDDTTTAMSGSETSTSETSTFDTDETSTGEEPDCGGFSIVPEFVAADLMLVVDTSSSMAELWDHDGDPMTPEVTRWSSAHAFIEALVTDLDGQMKLGLQRFPSAAACPAATLESANCTDADACLVASSPEVELVFEQGPMLLAALPAADADAVEIVGGSPASAGFMAARDSLLAHRRRNAEGIVLITDGRTNCGEGLSLPESFETYDASLAANVGDTFELDGIPTWVVGVDVDMTIETPGQDSPQIDAFAALNDVSVAGGQPSEMGAEPRKFYDVREPQALINALTPYCMVTTCDFDLTMMPEGPPAPSQIPLVTIEMAGSLLPYVEDCETEDGWAWIVEGEILSLCGSWCELLKDGDTPVDGHYGCPTES